MITPIMLPKSDKELIEQSPFVAAAMTVFGEARGASYEGQKAVANVIKNRAAVFVQRGKAASIEEAIRKVVAQPYAFSCFLANDPNRHKVFEPLKHEKPEVYESCLEAVRDVFVRNAEDNVKGATHYYVTKMKNPPVWKDEGEVTAEINGHTFLKGVRW